jgi:hypothetical protein
MRMGKRGRLLNGFAGMTLTAAVTLKVTAQRGLEPPLRSDRPAAFHAGRHPYARFTGPIFAKDTANMQC